MATHPGGYKVVYNRLPAMPAQARAGFNSLLYEYGHRAEARAKDLCPVDTGNLRASISVRIVGMDAVIGTSVEYAVYVELGTYKMAARSYIGQAIAEVGPRWIAATRAYLSGFG